MAIETIVDRNYSIQSDIWSYGIVLYEIFTLGQDPYGRMRADGEFVKKLQEGFRLGAPIYANKFL